MYLFAVWAPGRVSHVSSPSPTTHPVSVQFYGRSIVFRFFPHRFLAFQRVVAEYKSELFVRMTFLRIVPVTPNWFLNVASGQLRVPLPTFCGAVVVGLAPYNWLTCQAGAVLNQLTDDSRIIGTWTSVWLTIIAVVGFLSPSILRRVVGHGEGATLGWGRASPRPRSP